MLDSSVISQFSTNISSQPASVNTAIDSTNVGFQMLQKFGWKEKKGLGKNEEG